MHHKINVKELRCRNCDSVINIGHGEYSANPFCNDSKCFNDRLCKVGAIDLRNNYEIVDLGNGYAKIVPIDKNKKWKG